MVLLASWKRWLRVAGLIVVCALVLAGCPGPFTWGNGGAGQLGDGTTADRYAPVNIDVAWKTVSFGANHGAGVKSDGSLWTWGNNNEGELGDGTTSVGEPQPTRVGTDSNWSTVSAGNTFTVATKADGTLWAWGDNFFGELGDTTSTMRTAPTQIVTSKTDWVAAFTGPSSYTAFAIDGSGNLWGWGRNNYGQVGDHTTMNRMTPAIIGVGYRTVSTSWRHTLAITTGGQLWAWGNANDGELGDGTNFQRVDPVLIGTATNWDTVSAGAVLSDNVNEASTVARRTDGTIWAWGGNEHGQLGDNTTTNRNTPGQVGTDTNWTKISLGGIHVEAIKTDGSLWGWGHNGNGELADGTTTDRHVPTQIGSEKTWKTVQAGSRDTVALKTDGYPWAWGSNDASRLGIPYVTGNQTTPREIDPSWNTLSAGGSHALGIRSNQTLWAWGDQGAGDLGDGITSGTRSTPEQIGPFSDWKQVSAGVNRSIGLRGTGAIYTWGSSEASTPTQFGTDTDWASVSAGDEHFAAVKTNGDVYTWGGNFFGELGNGTTSTGYTTTPFFVGSGYRSVSAGWGYNLAIRTDGTLWAWGNNSNGQLGDGTTNQSLSPVPVGTATNWQNVSAGDLFVTHSAGLRTDGTLWAWGDNFHGEVGDGTTMDRHAPVQIGSAKWSAVSAGGVHNLAIRNDGTLWSWGGNVRGELGNGDTSGADQPTPGQIGTASDWQQVSAGGGFWSSALRPRSP